MVKLKYIKCLAIWLGVFGTCWTHEEVKGNSSKVDPAHKEIHDLWTTLSPKPAPIYRCNGWYGGAKAVIPKPPDCKMPPKHDENKLVTVTLFLPDLNRQTNKGYECYATKQSIWVSCNFLNYCRLGRPTSVYVNISRDECWDMIKHRKSPKGDDMNDQEGKIVGTSKELRAQAGWWSNYTTSVVNYFFREVMVSVFDLDETIITSTDIKRNCLYNESQCPTTFGILVWKASDFKTCRLTEIGTTSCLLSLHNTSNRLTCPELQISLHGITQKKMCNLTFGHSSQGYSFLQQQQHQVDKNISLSTNASGIITTPLKRERRDVNTDPNPQDMFNNGKYSYLYDKLKDSIEHSFQVIHHDICNLNFLLWTTLVSVAKIGYPSLLVQNLYRDETLRATFSGDALSVWSCTPIHTYKFLERKECMYEWPIVYLLDGKQYSEFVLPFSHAVADKPVPMPEPCSEFYFDAGEYFLHLTVDGPRKVNLPTLPQPVLGTKNLSIPSISFTSGSGISVTGFADYMHTQTLLREIHAKNVIIQTMRDKVEIVESKVAVIDIFTNFGTWLVDSVLSIWMRLSYFRYILIASFVTIILLLCYIAAPVRSVRTLSQFAYSCLHFLCWPIRKLNLFIQRRERQLPRYFENNRENQDVFDVQYGDAALRQRYARPSAPPLDIPLAYQRRDHYN